MRFLFTILLSAALTPPLFLVRAQTSPQYLITGEVRDPQGKPICGVSICATPVVFNPMRPQGQVCTASDRDGKFAIKTGKAGGYNLFYYGPEQTYLPQFNPFFRNPSIPIPQVLLSDSNTHATANIFMSPRNGRLIGKSFDAQTGLPLEGVEFLMCHAANPAVCWRKSASAVNGEFDIPAPHVLFTLKIRKTGFRDWTGLTGEEGMSAVSVPAETKTEFILYLKRLPETIGSAINEAEKRLGLNLPAPIQLHPENNEVFDIYPRLTRLEWRAVEGAVSYRVDLDACQGHGKRMKSCVDPQTLSLITNRPMRSILDTSYDFNFIGAQWGRWRVWAIDKDGREGFKSPWRYFVYYR